MSLLPVTVLPGGMLNPLGALTPKPVYGGSGFGSQLAPLTAPLSAGARAGAAFPVPSQHSAPHSESAPKFSPELKTTSIKGQFRVDLGPTSPTPVRLRMPSNSRSLSGRQRHGVSRGHQVPSLSSLDEEFTTWLATHAAGQISSASLISNLV